MTLLPLQHTARLAGHAERAEAHQYRGRDRGERRDEACRKLRLSALDRVEGEPRIAVSEYFDIPQPGDINVWHGERLGKICAVAIQHDNPRYSCSAVSSHCLNPGLANDFEAVNRHGFRAVNAWSPWSVRQEFRA